MPDLNRRNLMLMTGAAALAAAMPLPRAAAEPDAAPTEFVFVDDFDGPAGASPDRSKWTVANWNEPVTPPVLGLYRDDPRNVSLDGNGNLAIRATKEGDTYFTGRVESRFKIGINRTWEARVQLPMAPGLWPAYWLVNIEDTPDGRGPLPDGEVDIVEWYGNGEWAPGTSVHARSDGKTWNAHRWPVDGAVAHLPVPVGRDGLRPSGWTTSPDRRTSTFLRDPSTAHGRSTTPAICCSPCSISRSVVQAAAIRTSAAYPRRC